MSPTGLSDGKSSPLFFGTKCCCLKLSLLEPLFGRLDCGSVSRPINSINRFQFATGAHTNWMHKMHRTSGHIRIVVSFGKRKKNEQFVISRETWQAMRWWHRKPHGAMNNSVCIPLPLRMHMNAAQRWQWRTSRLINHNRFGWLLLAFSPPSQRWNMHQHN